MNYEKLGDGSLPSKRAPSNDGRLVHRCQGCGSYVFAFVLLRVTGTAMTEHDWVCDQCWVPWNRDRKPLAEGETYSCPEEWFANFIEDIGGSVPEVARLKSEARKEMVLLRGAKEREKTVAKNPTSIANIEEAIDDIDERLTGTRGRVT
jgi:hypothetical protein